MVQEPLHLGEGGAGVDEQSGVGVAQGVGQRPRRRGDPGSAVPPEHQRVEGLAVERHVLAPDLAGEEGSVGEWRPTLSSALQVGGDGVGHCVIRARCARGDDGRGWRCEDPQPPSAHPPAR